MKLVLGIETSGTDTGVALLAGEQVLAEISCPSVSGHNENLLRLVRQALGAHTVAGLAVIGVTIGPGMFTALRVGLAVAKGLALAAGAGLKGIGTLDALAAAVGGSGEVLTLVDARRREVYAALFRGGAAVLGPALVAI
ncbi:tRNA (adenosine(37)-N6)-threonylcarbamoyltransferase complex dimerization subunit type 1 TsaB, partial [candidate division WOR-3 bacterium]|nr:tRNA (adenosine(37)-N6)-threonylcarbamoyltransferase complex dimerization subunit type 1 TsaB [candidate division WOR-3 bacterium]